MATVEISRSLQHAHDARSQHVEQHASSTAVQNSVLVAEVRRDGQDELCRLVLGACGDALDALETFTVKAVVVRIVPEVVQGRPYAFYGRRIRQVVDLYSRRRRHSRPR